VHLRRTVPLLLMVGACFSEPSYEGRFCNAASTCPEGLSCEEGRCRLLVSAADGGDAIDAEPSGDAGEGADAGGPFATDTGGDSDANKLPDGAVPMDAAPLDASLEDAQPNDAAAPDADESICTTGDTRACYSGPNGSAGVGICREGRQLCAGGEFGTCEDEILPGVETCNGIDDDCDRVIDNGCPSGTITFQQPQDTPLTGWLPFGDEWVGQGCAPGDVVVGFFGHYADYLNEVGEHCDTPTIVADTTTTPYTYSRVLTPSASAVPRGGAMGTEYNAICPAGRMVVAISGLSGSWIDRLNFACAEFELVDTVVNGVRTFTVREIAGTRAQVTVNAGGAGGAAFDLPCPVNTAAGARLRGATGSTTCCPSLVTTLGLTCSTLGVTLR
jgi:hypothetical protein